MSKFARDRAVAHALSQKANKCAHAAFLNPPPDLEPQYVIDCLKFAEAHLRNLRRIAERTTTKEQA